MRQISLIYCMLFFTVIPGRMVLAQEALRGQQSPTAQSTAPTPTLPTHFYRLDFTVEEIGPEGKPINSRAYSTVLGTDSHELMSIRTGSRFPIATGSFAASGKENTLQSTPFQYVDLGVNFDVREVHEMGRQVSLNLTADLTGLTGQSDPNLHQPVTRHNRWQGLALIPTGKPTVVFSSDSLDSKGSTRILVTATPLQ
jgi:hypothetical protein